jgi:hypothetical protein
MNNITTEKHPSNINYIPEIIYLTMDAKTPNLSDNDNQDNRINRWTCEEVIMHNIG